MKHKNYLYRLLKEKKQKQIVNLINIEIIFLLIIPLFNYLFLQYKSDVLCTGYPIGIWSCFSE